jgi:hypothetical protein
MKRSHYEHDQQAALFRWRDISLRTYPELKWMYAIPNSARRSPRQGAWMKAEGMRAGIWDIHLPYPVQKNHGLWIEMKSPGKGLTKEQEKFMNDNINIFCFYIGFDWINSKNAIIKYLAGERF